MLEVLFFLITKEEKRIRIFINFTGATRPPVVIWDRSKHAPLHEGLVSYYNHCCLYFSFVVCLFESPTRGGSILLPI